MQNRALITGITGQDGSYLAEHLLSLGYDVAGLIRRNSNPSIVNRIPDYCIDKIRFYYGDVTDIHSIENAIEDFHPTEVYNLAAQSFVGLSWEQPFYTTETNAIGALNILSTLKSFNEEVKFYQASTSEMFGNAESEFQNEDTPFHPRSPYGVAKLYAHWMTVNYRESYDMFTCSGILFNHESILKDSPVIIKDENGLIDVLPIEELFKTESHRYDKCSILDRYKGISVWNGEKFTKIISGTCYQDKSKTTKIIQTRDSSYEATDDHVAFDRNNEEVKTKDWRIGDRVFDCRFPIATNILENDKKLAYFIGFVVGDGHVSESGNIRLTGTSLEELEDVAKSFSTMFGYPYRVSYKEKGMFKNCHKRIYDINFLDCTLLGKWLRKEIYTIDKEKKIPKYILNSSINTKKSFFNGYYLADGRKKGNERYQYKGFTTSSQTLCLGLSFLFSSISNQGIKVKCDVRNEKKYYYVQFTSPVATNKGRHLIKDKKEIISITESKSSDGWFFDIQTEDGSFCTGSNMFKIHNSPRRGNEFVTKKIVNGVKKLAVGGHDPLAMGNINSFRDWGYAPDYVKAMHLMMQRDTPSDYVIATGETHSIKEFIISAFMEAGIPIYFEGEGILEKAYDEEGNVLMLVDPSFFRPSEVSFLKGDYSKARKELGWNPTTNFEGLVKNMMKGGE